MVTNAENLIDDVYKTAVSLSHQGAIINLGFINRLDSTTQSNVFTLLSDATLDLPVLESAFVYIPSLSTVLHSSFRAYDIQSFPWNQAIMDYYNTNVHSVTIGENKTSCHMFYQGTGIYLVYEYLFSGSPDKATLFFRINTWNLYQKIAKQPLDQTGLWLYNDSGSPLFSSYVTYPDYLTAEFIQSLSDSQYETLSDKVLLTSISNKLGWKFIYTLDSSIVVSSVSSIFPTLLFILMIALIVAAVLSYFMSKSLYSPLKQLMDEIKTQSPSLAYGNSKNEIDYLRYAYSEITEKSSDLHNIIQSISLDITSRLFMELLSGKEINYDYVMKNIETISGSFHPHDLYAVGVLILNENQPSKIPLPLAQSQINSILHSICQRKALTNHIISRDYLTTIVILSFPKGTSKLSISRSLSELYSGLQKSAQREKITMQFRMGGIYHSVMDIGFSYKEAVNSISSEQKTSAVSEPAIIEHAQTDSANHLLKLLFDCIKDNEFEQAITLGKRISQKISTDSEHCIKEYQKLFNAFSDYIVNLDYINPSAFPDYLFLIEQTAPDSKSLAESAEKQFNELIDALISQQKKVQNHYILTAQKQIEKKYSDGSESLNSIAAAIGTNPTYLSKLFKQNLGITFTDYLNKYRINQSMELLKMTDLSIQDIAFSCGFNSSQHFVRVFKKYNQITPSQFRNENLIQHK